MLISDIDDLSALVHNKLTSLGALLNFNIVLTRDISISDSALPRLLDRRRLRESSKLVDEIFNALKSQQADELEASYAELRNVLETALLACNATHRCRIVHRQKYVAARIRQLSKRLREFTFQCRLQILD